MTKPVKFLFEANFDDRIKEPEPEDIEKKIEERLREEFEKTLKTEKEQAYELGFQDGETQALNSLEANIKIGIEKVIAQSQDLTQRFEQKKEEFQKQTVQLAFETAKYLSRHLITREPFSDVEALFLETLNFIRTEPHIFINVAEDLLKEAEHRILSFAEQQGYKGKITIQAQSDLEPGDWAFEWAQGGVTKHQAALEQAAKQAIFNYFEIENEDLETTDLEPIQQESQPDQNQDGLEFLDDVHKNNEENDQSEEEMREYEQEHSSEISDQKEYEAGSKEYEAGSRDNIPDIEEERAPSHDPKDRYSQIESLLGD